MDNFKTSLHLYSWLLTTDIKPQKTEPRRQTAKSESVVGLFVPKTLMIENTHHGSQVKGKEGIERELALLPSAHR